MPFTLFLCMTAILPAHASGLAMHGAPKLAPGFSSFPYADKRALQGGKMVQAQYGNFDSLNPFSVRGNVARNLRERVFESLLERNYDEAFALYPLLAEKVFAPDDRSFVTFTLNPAAKFSDGSQVTTDDVAFSWKTLRDRGRPNHRFYYGRVTHISRPTDNSISFHFDPESADREMALIIGLMPVLPKHIYETRDIQAATLDFPIGSGPYVVDEITPGAQVRFQRNPNYWGANLPVMAGRHNISTLVDDYYRDQSAAFEAFKSGLVDVWLETDSQRWLGGYSFPAARDGRIVKQEIKLGTPSGLRAIVMNTRRPLLASAPLRQVMDLMFDFQWINKILYGGLFNRTQSYFGNTVLSAAGRVASSGERAILGNYLSAQALETGYRPPLSDGSGRDREVKRQALAILDAAGYRLDGQTLRAADGTQVSLELLVQRREDERLALAYRRMLAQIGIDLSVRLVDASQYQRRLQNFDFDMIIYSYYASLSPGNEQAYYW
ncbi:MAG: extracellular solute-binding protein, partial [Pseudomonadota bacterium]|nr:extracellular solute-binding protein [Pseudomonadota bacterium]